MNKKRICQYAEQIIREFQITIPTYYAYEFDGKKQNLYTYIKINLPQYGLNDVYIRFVTVTNLSFHTCFFNCFYFNIQVSVAHAEEPPNTASIHVEHRMVLQSNGFSSGYVVQDPDNGKPILFNPLHLTPKDGPLNRMVWDILAAIRENSHEFFIDTWEHHNS